MQGRVDLVGLVIHTEVVYPPEDHPITVLTGLNLRVTLFMDERSYRYAKPSSTDRTIKHTIHYSLRLEFETTLIIGGRPENVLSCFVKISSRVWATGLLNLVATPLNKQETFEKYWAHSPGGATVARRHCRTPPAHRCQRQRRQQQRQWQRVTEGTAMAPYNGPNHCTLAVNRPGALGKWNEQLLKVYLAKILHNPSARCVVSISRVAGLQYR